MNVAGMVRKHLEDHGFDGLHEHSQWAIPCSCGEGGCIGWEIAHVTAEFMADPEAFRLFLSEGIGAPSLDSHQRPC